jgi:hypothetical protein
MREGTRHCSASLAGVLLPSYCVMNGRHARRLRRVRGASSLVLLLLAAIITVHLSPPARRVAAAMRAAGR